MLQVKSKVQTGVLDEFLFADDMAKGAPTEEKMQKGVGQISDSCDSYDRTISIKKTEVVYQPAPGKPYKEPTITLWCCQHYCVHAKRGQFTNGMPKDRTTSIQAALENF